MSRIRGLSTTLVEATELYPITILEGLRDVGKTTLVKQLIESGAYAQYCSFQSAAELASAQADPESYVASLEYGTIIDEAQLVEEITLPMKNIVDSDSRPGRFLLTGSERLSRRVMGGLVGRTSPHYRLEPLTLGERENSVVGVVDSFVSGKLSDLTSAKLDQKTLVRNIGMGGMPRVVAAPELAEAPKAWFETYFRGTLALPAFDQADIRGLESTFRYIAGQTSQLVNLNSFGKKMGRDARTVENYISKFESAFLIRRLPGWRSERYKSETASAKLHVCDTGLATHFGSLRVTESPEDLGKIFETFVVNELIAQASWSESKPTAYHWRDSNRHEIDCVLDTGQKVACFAAKPSRKVDKASFRSIEFFKRRYPDRFAAGYVIYLGDELLPFGDDLWAVPVKYLAAKHAA